MPLTTFPKPRRRRDVLFALQVTANDAGDVVTQDGGRILAAVCDGDLEPIKALIVNRKANEYCRGMAVNALALLAAWAEVPREPVVAYFLWLAREGLEHEPSQVWNSLAADSADIEAVGVFPELRRACDDGLIERQFMDPSELDQVEAAPRGRFLERMREQHPPIDDVVEATAWWGRFAHERASRTAPYRASPKVGRNEPCPCGSGKKYKKCCGRCHPPEAHQERRGLRLLCGRAAGNTSNPTC